MSDLRVATRPPMGWNSWDCFGASVTEEDVRKNALVMSELLKKYGWEYIVVDIQWSEPTADSSTYHDFYPLCMDEYSRLIPAENRFPSSANGKGFKPLADYIHSLGLKFGIHIMRGIPRQAVHQNTAIKGTNKRAREIALNSICPWNTDMYGVNTNIQAGQAYYDSLFELYASWGVDFVKVDDIADSKLYGSHLSEIKAISQSIEKCGRPMVLSLSPGPASLEDGTFLQEHANMWRLTDDFWDTWAQLRSMFDRCAKWTPFVQPGSWPDCDMLPLGHIGIRSVDGRAKERQSRFTKSEQRLMLSLWAIFQSPLMYGGDLSQIENDTWSLSLLQNSELYEMHQSLISQRQLQQTDTLIIWEGKSAVATYLAVFNVSEESQTYEIKVNTKLSVYDIWQRKSRLDVKVTIEPHDVYLIKLT